MNSKFLFKSRVSADAPVFLQDHVVYGRVVFPATAYVEMALAVGKHVFKDQSFLIENFLIENPLAFEATESVEMQTTVSQEGEDYKIGIFSRRPKHEEWTAHAQAVLRKSHYSALDFDSKSVVELRAKGKVVEGEDYYAEFKKMGFAYGPAFQGLAKGWLAEGEALAEIHTPDGLDTAKFNLHPAVLDACFHAVSGVAGARESESVFLPVSIERISFYSSPKSSVVYSHVRSLRSDSKMVAVDVRVIDREGALVADVSGLKLLKTSEAALRSRITKQDPLLENCYTPTWIEKKSAPNAKASGRWLILADRKGLATELADNVRGQGGEVKLVTREQFAEASQKDFAQLLASTGRPDQVVYMWGMDCDNIAEMSVQEVLAQNKSSLGALLSLVQSLNAISGVKLSVITEGAQAVNSGEIPNANQSALWGFARVIAAEYPEMGCKRIDIDGQTEAAEVCAAISSADGETQIAFRGRAGYVLRLQRSRGLDKQMAQIDGRSIFKADATYLITGGLGAIGLGLAKWLVQSQGVKYLALVGRTVDAAKIAGSLAEMAKAGAKIKLIKADIASADDARRMFAEIAQDMPPLKGIAHAAGLVADAAIAKQDWNLFEKVLLPKICGSINLHNATREMQLDFFVAFSSMSATAGNFGQSNYAAANSWLDGFCAQCNAAGLPYASVAWGPWAAGMAANVKSFGGLTLIEMERGARAFALAAQSPSSSFVYAEVNWDQYRERIPLEEAAFYGDFVRTHRSAQAAAPAMGSAELEKIAALSLDQKRTALIRYLSALAEKVLGLDAASLDASKGLMAMGMDSMLAVEFRQRLAKELGPDNARKVSATLIFNYPTIEAIADYLLKEFFSGESKFGALDQIPAKKKRPMRDANSAIAVVGMGCRFPGGAHGPRKFWQMLANGTNAVELMKGDRWNVDAFYDPDPATPGKTYLKHGAFLDRIQDFDASFFGISPREAMALDPQQRLLLETTWEAIEHGGLSPAEFAGANVGVFVGSMYLEYQEVLRQSPDYNSLEAYIASGNNQAAIAGRLSYIFGFRGPAITVDTACSSSLVAIDLAVQKLRDGNVDYALAGGVNVIVNPLGYILMSRYRPFSFKGRCATFDAAADGYLRGEGCGMIMLRRLADAEADGNRILAVIRGTGVNQDGISSSFSAPNGIAQQELHKTVLEDARLNPHEVTYVEAHGTGTPLGDPIEVKALENAYAPGREKSNPLFIGSVKTNFGHTEGAAGIAGVIKTILSLQNKKIPKHLHFTNLNPEISFESFPAAIPTELVDWPGHNGKRIAGVSGFGITGTNAHVIIEEYDKPASFKGRSNAA